MADKLSEATWTGFTRKHRLDLDDGPLVKALARLDKIGERPPEPRLEALEAVVEQCRKQVLAQARRKKELGDKLFGEVKDQLNGLLDLAEKLHKDLRDAARKAEAAGDDDEESPALLTSKMVPLLREVRKGDVTLQALIALAGKETVVLLSRRSISPSRGKLLKDQMTQPSGLKFVRGECLFEQGALTFVVQSPAAGLAKRIKAALLLQTEMRAKVRVRGDDGEDNAEDDGDAPEATTPPAPQRPPAAAPPAAAPAPTPTATAAPAPAVAPGSDQPPAAVSQVVLQQSRLAWDKARKLAHAELDALKATILDAAQGEPRQAEIAEALKLFDALKARFDESLLDKLDEALNAADPQARAACNREAAQIIRRHQAALASDPLMKSLSGNPFLSVNVEKTLTATLGVLASKLGA